VQRIRDHRLQVMRQRLEVVIGEFASACAYHLDMRLVSPLLTFDRKFCQSIVRNIFLMSS
jgi:hypothetical protein